MNDNDDVNLLVPEREADEELGLKIQAEEIKSIILKLGVWYANCMCLFRVACSVV